MNVNIFVLEMEDNIPNTDVDDCDTRFFIIVRDVLFVIERDSLGLWFLFTRDL